MNEPLVIAPALRQAAERALTGLLAEAGADVDRRAWARLEQVLADENRERILAGEQPLAADVTARAVRALYDLFFGFGPLQPYLEDPNVEEIILNSPSCGFVLRAGAAKEQIDPGIGSDQELRTLLTRIVTRAGRRIDDSCPAVDARLPDGSRLHAVLPPIAAHPALTIRRHRMVAQTLDDLIDLGTLTLEAARFLRAAVSGGLNLLVSGGTASGKTTTLNALGREIPDAERVVTIEETTELRLAELLADCVALETRAPNAEGVGYIGIRELVRHALRMRPTRIVVGEVRGPEALDMLAAMNSGHEGSMGTIHANSARQALSKLRTYVLMGEEQMSSDIALELIAETVNLVVHVRFDQASTRRRIVQIAEVAGLEAGRVLTNDLFVLEGGELVRTSLRARNAERLGEIALAPAVLGGGRW